MTDNKEEKKDSSEEVNIIEESKNMEIAVFYTQGNVENAKLMLSGNYKDLYVLKISFSSTILYGAFLIFFNHINNVLSDCYGVIANSYLINDMNPSIDWKIFEKNISENLNEKIQDSDLLISSLYKIREEFNKELSMKLGNLIKNDDRLELSMLIKRNILDDFNKNVITYKVNIDYEEISSLDMELESKTSIKITPEQLAGQVDIEENKEDIAEESKKELEEAFAKEDRIDLSEVKLILNGILALDPIKGMHISGLVVKDKIKIKIVDNNPKAIPIAKAFNAYKDGQMNPIIGSIISYRRRKEGGYKLFVEIAKGIYIRINEDEDIKVSFISPSPKRDKKLQVDIEKYVDKYVEQRKEFAEKTNTGKIAKGTDKKYDQITIFIVIGVVVTVFAAVFLLLFMLT